MKTSSLSGLVPVVLAAVLVAGVTVVQGMFTDRWSGRNVKADLKEAAERLEARFPNRFGSWEYAQELASDPKQLERAGAVGHISKLFTNRETGAKVSAFIVCATPHDASGHTPDRCYPGAGFEIAESEHRQSIPLEDGRKAETFTGTFRKTGQTLRVFWTYGVDGRWLAPQIARIELAGTSAVYKLYAIIDETRLPGGESTVICADFLSALLPEFDEAMFGIKQGENAEPEGEKPPAGTATDPAETALISRRMPGAG
ncbi:MAG: exosortase-associated EpsI family protein [Planctomycetia bacterium]